MLFAEYYYCFMPNLNMRTYACIYVHLYCVYVPAGKYIQIHVPLFVPELLILNKKQPGSPFNTKRC